MRDSNTVSVIAKDKYPSGTTILSATSDDRTVLNNTGTEDDGIEFDVHTGIAGLYPVAGFQCSLGLEFDTNEPFQSCGGKLDSSGVSIIKYENLDSGLPYIIQIRAVDTHGNVDPKPIVFLWSTPVDRSSSLPSPNYSTIPGNGTLHGGFSIHGGNSIAITGSANGGDGILKGIGGNGGHSGSATSTAGNIVNGNSWHTGENNNP